MSKAFTKDDDGPAPVAVPPRGAVRLTPLGARLMRESGSDRYRALLERAVIEGPTGSEVAGFGAEVRVRWKSGREQTVLLVSPEETDIVPNGCSVSSPLGRALVGARVGDAVEVETPRGVDELEVLAVT